MKGDKDAPWQAVNCALYAMAEVLERNGALDQDDLADELLRYNDPEREILNANIRGIAQTLRSRPFGPRKLGVIDGGKQD